MLKRTKQRQVKQLLMISINQNKIYKLIAEFLRDLFFSSVFARVVRIVYFENNNATSHKFGRESRRILMICLNNIIENMFKFTFVILMFNNLYVVFKAVVLKKKIICEMEKDFSHPEIYIYIARARVRACVCIHMY